MGIFFLKAIWIIDGQISVSKITNAIGLNFLKKLLINIKESHGA